MAQHLGLIVNEAVTNAVNTETGTIRIEILNQDRAQPLLSICDNRRGIDPHLARGSGSGLRLVEALARQLRGTVEWENKRGEGTLIWVTFPRPIVAFAGNSPTRTSGAGRFAGSNAWRSGKTPT